MATMWQKTMNYLGLGPDEEYDDDARYEDAPPREGRGPAPVEASVGANMGGGSTSVRTLTREQNGGGVTARPRASQPRAVATMARPSTSGPVAPKTIAPRGFDDAQEVADNVIANTPVVLDLAHVDKELSRRLVDFSSGLCYGLNANIHRVNPQVYLITPANVEVSAEDRRRLQERST
jgi:cell division inhibitor SepF